MASNSGLANHISCSHPRLERVGPVVGNVRNRHAETGDGQIIVATLRFLIPHPGPHLSDTTLDLQLALQHVLDHGRRGDVGSDIPDQKIPGATGCRGHACYAGRGTVDALLGESFTFEALPQPTIGALFDVCCSNLPLAAQMTSTINPHHTDDGTT